MQLDGDHDQLGDNPYLLAKWKRQLAAVEAEVRRVEQKLRLLLAANEGEVSTGGDEPEAA